MKANPPVRYAREPALGVSEFRDVLIESGPGATRPVEAAGFHERSGMPRMPDAFWYRRTQ
jgi:hypothetical protein